MKRVMVAAAMVLSFCVAYALAHLALIEVGREVVILHKWTPGGAVHKTRLWIVDEGRESWLHHGAPEAAWIRRLETEAMVTIERRGRTRQYRARPESGGAPARPHAPAGEVRHRRSLGALRDRRDGAVPHSPSAPRTRRKPTLGGGV